MISSSRPPQSAGFTRLDLLALAAVLTVLAMLSLGAATTNRAGNLNATCIANLNDLTRAWQQFALDQGHFPPNPDDGTTVPGNAWVPGIVSPGGAQQFNSDILADSARSLLYPYLRRPDVAVFRCPANPTTGRYEGSDPQQLNATVPMARSYSMNGAVGTDPYSANGELAVNGPWLDNNHSHLRGLTWRTYARFEEVLAPAPDKLAVLIDEDPMSINDGSFAFGMARPEWIDWPSSLHDRGGTLSYADGHAELHHWIDPRTTVINGNVSRSSAAGSFDYDWLRQRISAPIQP